MVQIILSISKKHDKKLRDIAMSEFGGKKGALSAIVERGIDLADEEIRQSIAREKILRMAKNAKSSGNWNGKFNRNDAYAERMRKILG